MAIESPWLLMIFIVAAQISVVLLDAIVPVKYFRLLILAVELIDYKVHKVGIGLCFYFRKLG